MHRSLVVALFSLLLVGCAVADGSGSDAGQPAGNCNVNYAGACLKPDSPDYDCSGGEGNGPDYTGPVRVVGDDPYDLDRDGDGAGCESS